MNDIQIWLIAITTLSALVGIGWLFAPKCVVCSLLAIRILIAMIGLNIAASLFYLYIGALNPMVISGLIAYMFGFYLSHTYKHC